MAERVDSLSRIGEDSRGNEWAGASTTGSLRTRVKDPESQLRGLGWEEARVWVDPPCQSLDQGKEENVEGGPQRAGDSRAHQESPSHLKVFPGASGRIP